MNVAIVGGGLAGITAYATLRHAGIAPDEITVFGDHADPAAAWSERARAIRQRRMRSESDGHVAATSFPGLAVRSALRRRSAAPLVRSVCNRYHPSVDEFLEHVADVRTRSGWDDSFVRARVQRVRAVDGGFEIDAPNSPSDTLSLDVFPNVLLAPGHAGLAFPPELAGDPRSVHAYRPHEYADEVAVVGAGMAAATEWRTVIQFFFRTPFVSFDDVSGCRYRRAPDLTRKSVGFFPRKGSCGAIDSERKLVGFLPDF